MSEVSGARTVVAVVGPTASGKTALAVELALRHGGEVISCDSMQVYSGMDVGSAKVTEGEMRGVRHHMLSVAPPDTDFSCADYAKMARCAVEDILSRGKLPIFCGGTGLYLDAVLKNNEFSAAGRDDEYRSELRGSYSPTELHAMLGAVDPVSAAEIHPNNVNRVIRALEIYKLTGKPKSWWDVRSRTAPSPYRSIKIGLAFRSRERLYARIDRRVDIMMESGLLEEVRTLGSESFRRSTASQAIGYKELLEYLDGGCTLDRAVDGIKKASRNYAKRQLTWFSRDADIDWIYADDAPEDDGALRYIAECAEGILERRGL